MSAILLIIIYLAIPVASHAVAAMPDAHGNSPHAVSGALLPLSPDTCPCSDNGGHVCCDASCGCCVCSAPLGQCLQLKYAPIIVTQLFPEFFWSLPQVYLTIFVPPQNAA
ncbi:MAG: hypothetical protein PHY09_16365 [Desulfuromonadaceae bacterium]|nr:hypothetical protein [Desulfuromonadaceae bacterium]